MLGEIDKVFYCSASAFLGASDGSTICLYNDNKPCRQDKGCLNYKHKYPTPEQYKEAYGEEWTGAVYSHCTDDDCDTECKYREWGDGEEYGCLEPIAVCACTPWGKPPDGWRPE